ncbi:sulfatase [Daejeonella sp.]|uniref:sulfatase family protein n=1 Tax=Daejeonella sp. TaxID=2805397 RepID=UPI003982F3F4
MIRIIIPALLFLISCSCVNAENKPPDRPNILIIMTDQQSASMMSCTGNKWLKTPAMDAIAATGINFSRAYATNPVCLSSRFSLQTGRFPSEIGMRENNIPMVDKARLQSLYSKSIGSLFQQAGYQTYYGGKVQLPVSGSKIEPWGYELLASDEREGLSIAAADFLLHRKKEDKPFLLFTSFINPHDICYNAIRSAYPDSKLAKNTPKELDEALQLPDGISEDEFFRKVCPTLPDNHQPMIGELSSVDSLIKLSSFRNIVRENWSERDWRMHRWAYMRLTERVDAQIAVVMDALKKSGLSENTIVIFTSDHGDHDASHKLEHKTMLYEEAANIPFLISYPWMKKKGTVDNEHLVSNGLDLLPTLCDFAGIQPPAGLMGRSVVPLTEQKKITDWPNHIYLETETGYMIHTGRYKYELDDIGEIREMFVDLKIDKGETKNLIESPRHKKIIASLRSKLTTSLMNRSIPFNPPSITK